jgi:hypothetical protein
MTYIQRRLKSAASFTSEKHPIVWVAIQRNGGTIKYIGICGKTWEPCFFTQETMVALVTKDIETDLDLCQDEDRCFNIQCPLNRTTPESLAESKQMGPKSAKQLKENWETYMENFSKKYSKLAELCKKEFEDNGSAHIVWVREISKAAGVE